MFGAVTGVGIWFAIGLAHPEATSALIHNFVFAWAIEWVFFMVELTTAAVYYYTWDRIPDPLHLKVGWVYAIASFFTLFIINGILTFMLTPGQPWLAVAGTGMESSRFVQALFNPLFWPSLFLRMLACASLAGVWALVTCARIDGEKVPRVENRAAALEFPVGDSLLRAPAHLFCLVSVERPRSPACADATGHLDRRRRRLQPAHPHHSHHPARVRPVWWASFISLSGVRPWKSRCATPPA